MLLLLLYFILGTSNASQDVINTGGKTIHVFSERGRNDRLNRPNSFLMEDPDKNIPGSWPWAVSIGYQDGWNWVHACDGVIVTNGSVVTSAACLALYEEWAELTVETLSVRAGDNHLKFNDYEIQLANVSRHEKHPGFNASAWPMEHYEDVAVLFLLPSLNFTRSVKPIYIPTLEEGITTTKAKDTDITLTACGWGGKFKVGGRKLQDAVITSLEDNFCHFVYRGDGLSKNLTDEILCAANVIDLSGTCKVGQGSGIFQLYHDPVDHTKNRYVLTGILSSHIESDGNITCGSPHTPNVFVRVASRSILSFLYKTIYNIESDSSAAAAAAQPSIELDQEPTLDPYYESCGVNNIIDHILDMESSGTNGQLEKATWPWLVPLLVNRTTPMNFEFICAGTILTEDKILTAAHCFDGIYDEMMIKIRAGDVFLNNAIDDSMVQEVYINKSDVTIHPNYTENRYFDLAILHLRSKFNFSTKVRPVCLLSPQEAATITKNNETLLSILVSGWGRDSLGRYGQDLWQIIAEIFSKAICDNTYRDSSHIRNLLPNLFTEDVLCAGDPAGDSGTCHGDSGGGAVHFDQKRRRYVARAVVSGSKHGQCASGFAPNIYARLADAIVNNWIFSQINFTAPTDMVFEDGNYTFVSGSTVTYNCSTTSNPVSQISWTLTDHLNNTLLFQESSSEERFGQNWMKTSRITFVFPRDSDSVEAKCTGKNVMGHLSATAVLSAGSVSVKLVSGYPYLSTGAAWKPICGHYFWDNNNGASLFCKKLGYSLGGSVTKERQAYAEDAYYVGRCGSGDIADFETGCTKHHESSYKSNYCKKGKNASIKITCKGPTYVALNNGPGCGNAAISSSSECGIAASFLGYSGKVQDVIDGNVPPGCVVGHAVDGWKYTYFNRNATGSAGSNMYRSVCHSGVRYWSSAQDKIWGNDECPHEGGHSGLSLEECKKKCLDTPSCTAINYRAPQAPCILRGCDYPVPAPQWTHGNYKGYSIQEHRGDIPLNPKCATACESGQRKLDLSCPETEKIGIKFAVYGRLEASTCPSSAVNSTACSSSTAWSKVKELCEGKQACEVDASNANFGDPCVGTQKYLSVCYICSDIIF